MLNTEEAVALINYEIIMYIIIAIIFIGIIVYHIIKHIMFLHNIEKHRIYSYKCYKCGTTFYHKDQTKIICDKCSKQKETNNG